MALIKLLYKYNPSLLGVCGDMLRFISVLGIAFVIGVTIGWSWRPKWLYKLTCFLSIHFQDSCTSSLLQLSEKQLSISSVVTEDDLEHLIKLVEKKDGGPNWIPMMDRVTQTMTYRAWRRSPENGPPEYCTSTIFEDASTQMMRDFFWDDEFRPKWDDMHSFSATVEECPITGTMIVNWIRKFPFFVGDRIYTIARRIWRWEKSYYCVTKGVPSVSIPRRNKPRCVESYYSSWYIRAVESRRGNGQMNACEVLFFHHEDIGIPWELAKLGVRQGMWGTITKIERGFRIYQNARASGTALSRSALMARINTDVTREFLRDLAGTEDLPHSDTKVTPEKPSCSISKLMIFGGVIAFACSIDKGVLTKTFIFGVGRKLANIGKTL